MPKFFILMIVVSQSLLTRAKDFSESEKRLKEYCSQFVAYQPGWPDLLEAVDILSIRAKRSACFLYEKMGLTEDHNLILKGYRSVPGGNEFSYWIVDFRAEPPVEQSCIATSRYDESGRGTEVYTVACRPRKMYE